MLRVPRFALRALCFVSLPSCLVSPAAGSDWPQWLGPNRDGSTSEKVAPWKGDLKVLWRKSVGEGHSSPIVAEGIVYLHTRVKDKDEEAVQAFDAKTGELKWEKTYPRAAFSSSFGVGPRATPAVAGKRLYTFGVTGVLSCWDISDGKLHWQVDTLKELQTPNLNFGISASPLVVGGRVVVQVGNDGKKPQGSCVVAFEADSGNVAWKALDDPASYAAPVVLNGQLVVLTGAHLAGLDPTKGRSLWTFPFKDLLNESSTTPVRVGNLVIASSVTAGSVAVQVTGSDEKFNAAQLWKQPTLNSYFTTPVPVGEKHFFMVTGKLIPPPSATLHCVEAETGKVAWSKPKVGTYHASLTRLGDGNGLMLDDHGYLSLVAPDVKEYKELARSKVLAGNGDIWAHPALAGGRLCVRDGKELLCLQMGTEN
jgi:outer membrane protein assembly factor BamB